MTVGFVGLSHLGLVSSVVAASRGHEVVAYDPDRDRCDALNAGRLPITELGLPEALAAGRPRVRVTSEPALLRACELIICASDIPTSADNHSDLSVVSKLLDTAIAHAEPGTTLVVLSQVPPGFTRRLDQAIQRQQADRKLTVFYQVETLVFGSAVERARHPERFIVGCRSPQEDLPTSYAAFLSSFGCPILRMRYESAELAKISVNLLLVSSICTTNMLAEMCERIGADWSEIVPALTLDRRIGPSAYLTPGLGLSGGNLERDMITASTLAAQHGTRAGLIQAWIDDSRYRREWVLRHLQSSVLCSTPEAVVAVWGLAYKAGTASTKNAPAMALLEALRGRCVRAYDPMVSLNGAAGPRVLQTASALEACRGADALVIMAPWPEFSAVKPAQIREHMRGDLLIDPFGAVDGRQWTALGGRYFRLGAPARATSPILPMRHQPAQGKSEGAGRHASR